ncbi:hypothetical protein GA0116948_103370 [Chitinophaga costaii]|uniref:Uncharacterized protein n=1 Tax=Chitinophaga costaii TaxID=1335309 RepID=A0A1C4C2D4_9BACT|nr:hypothetical protein [Chitinophaga costaii]PUZ27364.1 hypothetical protein DCM91_03815 [Chitinophaga costaii]SCC13240.1 hypothetical protein GA0116948_103370 [Chitinophaga costaii]
MKQEEVPQDGNGLTGGKFSQLFYAVNKEGAYVQVSSVGWEPENVAMAQAWDEIHQKTAATRQAVLAGKLSPIAYYMEKNLMTVEILAGYVGKFQWQVKRHLKPSVFKQLSDHLLQRYAATFKISVAELKQFSPTTL